MVEQLTSTAGAGRLSRRERQRQATMQEIVAAARELVPEPGGLTLRAVAQRMGITAPALYRYVSSLQDLVELVAFDIDGEVARLLAGARDSQPEDDPAARIVCTSIAFRRWALSHKAEFSLVFANPVSAGSCERHEEMTDSPTGVLFSELLGRLWEKYRFPVPRLEDLEPDVAEALRDPSFPAAKEAFANAEPGLMWLFMRSWASLYGTVTLEVFGHLDPTIIESGAMFRAMLADQAARFAIEDELPRLLPMILDEMAR